MLSKIDMLDQFYSIKNIRVEGDFAEVELILNSEHIVYEGHFPGMPVVPGVCSLMMVKECVEKVTNRKYSFQYINTCKFLSAIRPDECKTLRIRLERKESSDSACIIQAQVFAGDGVVLKLKANLIAR